MKCPKCGNQLGDNDRVCPFCGQEVLEDIDTKENIIFKQCAEGIKQDEKSIPEEEKEDEKSEKKVDDIMPQKHTDNDSNRKVQEREEPERKKRWSPVPLIIGLLITILIIGSAAFAAYYTYNHSLGISSKNYIDSAQNLDTRIDKINNDFVKVLDKDEKNLPVDDILKKIPGTINSLDSVIKDYQGIISPSLYSDSNRKLGEALSLNKSIYQLLATVLKTPTDSNAQQTFDRLSDTINSCMSEYSSIQIGDLDFSLPDKMLTLTSRVQPWLSQKQADYQQVAALIDSYSNYFNSIDNLSVSFDAARTDFNQTLTGVRNNQSTWDQFFSQLDNSENQLKDIQTKYKKLSVPSDLRAFNKGYAQVLQDSLLYIDKIRYAAQTEKNFKKDGLTEDAVTTQTKAIDALYQDAEKTDAAVLSEDQKFLADMKSVKDKFLDPQYVLNLKKKK